jgi:hypothetical protein
MGCDCSVVGKNYYYSGTSVFSHNATYSGIPEEFNSAMKILHKRTIKYNMCINH